MSADRGGVISSWTSVLGADSTRADRLAAKRVASRLEALGAEPVGTLHDLPTDGRCGVILIGTPRSSVHVAEQARRLGLPLDGPTLGRDGFVLKLSTDAEGRPTLLLAGVTVFSVLCAWDEFRLRVNSLDDLAGLDVVSRPAFARREYKMPLTADDDFLIDRRINVVTVDGWHGLNTGFLGLHAGMSVMDAFREPGWPRESWTGLAHVQTYRRRFGPRFLERMSEWYDLTRRRLGELRDMGVEVLATRYEFAYPMVDLCYEAFPDECLEPERGSGPPVICGSKPRVHAMLRRVYETLFEQFPELGGVYVFFSGEGGTKPCVCDACREGYATFRADEMPAVPGLPESGEPATDPVFRLWLHNRFFGTVYETVRRVRPDATIVRNAWEFAMAPWKTRFAAATIPKDVILRSYTTSGDTNLMEPPSPETAAWREAGFDVSPKMCQLLEMHARSECFPNLLVSRMREFYAAWRDQGVCGACLHGGWYPNETTETCLDRERNIGFGYNHVAHWKLMWDPDRDDLDEFFDAWLRERFGESAPVARRCLERAGEIQALDGRVPPIIGDDVRARFSEYVFCVHYVLLNNKYPCWYFGNFGAGGGNRFDDDFLRAQHLLPAFKERMRKALDLLERNISELESHLDRDDAHPNAAHLLDWFRVEREYLNAMSALYRGQELRLLEGRPDQAAPFYGQALDELPKALQEWSRIAVERRVWVFHLYGTFHPYHFLPVKPGPEGGWLDKGIMPRFFDRLASLANPGDDEEPLPDGAPALDTTGIGLALDAFADIGPVS